MKIQNNERKGIVTFSGDPELGSVTLTGGRVLATHRTTTGWEVIDCRQAKSVPYHDGLRYVYGQGFLPTLAHEIRQQITAGVCGQ